MAYQAAPTLWVYTMSEVLDGDTYKAKFTLVDVCERYTSLLWDIAYYGPGSFEVYLPASPENFALFRAGYIVAREDDTDHYGIIEQVSVEADTENGDYLTVSGRFLPCLLSRRIIYPTAYSLDTNGKTTCSYSGFVFYVLAKNGAENDADTVTSINANYSDSTVINTARVIPGMTLLDSSGNIPYTSNWLRRISADNTQSKAMQVSYDNLMDWVYKMCEVVGGTIAIDASDAFGSGGGYLRIALTQGDDLSDTIVFSDTYSNLRSLSYADSYTERANVIYPTATYNDITYCVPMPLADAPERLDRFELHAQVDNFEPAEDSTAYESDAFTAALTAYASNVSNGTSACEAEIIADNPTYTYGTDYKVGDIVSIQYDRLGITIAKARLTDMIESFDQTGRTLTPTFDFDVE